MRYRQFAFGFNVVLIVVALIGCGWDDAKAEDFSKGFRGIKWGSDVSTVPGMLKKITLNHALGTCVFTKKDEDLIFWKHKVRDISYYTTNNKLDEVILWLGHDSHLFEAFEGYINNNFSNKSIPDISDAFLTVRWNLKGYSLVLFLDMAMGSYSLSIRPTKKQTSTPVKSHGASGLDESNGQGFSF